MAADFIIRPLGVSTTSGAFITPALDADGKWGVNFEVEVAAISGPSAELKVVVQTSVDGRNWSDLEGEVTATSPTILRIFRLELRRFVRIRGELAGTSPSATYAIEGNWLGKQSYPTITASIDNKPLTQGGTANFSGTTGVAGVGVHYDLIFDAGPGVHGDTTTDRNGDWSASGSVPLVANVADLTVLALGQTAEDSSVVNP